MKEATVRERLAQLAADGRLSPGDTVSMPGADFYVHRADGTTVSGQLKITTKTETYTKRTIDIVEFARPLPNRSRSPRTNGISAESFLRVTALLLPGPVRHRYLEEWRGELYDLRTEGASWWCRTAELVQILLYAGPRMAVITRRAARRVVE